MKTKQQKRPKSGRPSKPYLDKITTLTISVKNPLIVHFGKKELKAQLGIFLNQIESQLIEAAKLDDPEQDAPYNESDYGLMEVEQEGGQDANL